jgi:hypothetical protein
MSREVTIWPPPRIRREVGQHGLATELAESEPITVLQTQMRHADVRTTLKVYAHVIPQSQRDSMERIAKRPQQRTCGDAGTDSPVVDCVLYSLRNRNRPDVATFSPRVSDDPMALAKLEIL